MLILKAILLMKFSPSRLSLSAAASEFGVPYGCGVTARCTHKIASFRNQTVLPTPTVKRLSLVSVRQCQPRQSQHVILCRAMHGGGCGNRQKPEQCVIRSLS